MSDSLAKRSLSRRVYLHTADNGDVIGYLYLEYYDYEFYVAMAIQGCESAVHDKADVILSAVNVHVTCS